MTQRKELNMMRAYCRAALKMACVRAKEAHKQTRCQTSHCLVKHCCLLEKGSDEESILEAKREIGNRNRARLVTNTTSPVTNLPLTSTQLLPNMIASRVARHLRDQQPSTASAVAEDAQSRFGIEGRSQPRTSIPNV